MKLGLKNTVFITLITSLCIGVILVVFSPFFHVLNKQVQNGYYTLKQDFIPIESHPNILLVELDQESMSSLGTFPFPRSNYAKIIENFVSYDVAVIALDFLFLDESEEQEDEIFATSLQENRVVLGSAIGNDGAIRYPYSGFHSNKNDSGFLSPNVNTRNNTVYDFTPAYTDPNTGKDIEHFTLAILRKFFAYLYNEDSYFQSGEYDDNFYHFSDTYAFPLSQKDSRSILIHFGNAESFETISFSDALDSKKLKQLDENIDLKDKIILIGPAADGFNDEFFTPNGREYGMYIHANILSTLLSKNFLIYFNRYLEWILIFLVVVISVYTNLSRNKLTLIFANIAIIAVFWFVLPLTILLSTNLLFNFPSEIIFSFLLSFTAANIIKFLIEDANKKKLNAALSQYVSADIASEILSESGNINLDGQKKKLVCFFSDIENFTHMSEKLSPEELVAFLREYLGEMTNIIMQQDGHIDKFEGDAIMALWGAFRQHKKDDYIKACSAALAQQETVKKYNQTWRRKFGSDIHVRMGIHGGEAIVGNIGAEGQKMDFTALGDNVNLASRLEGINKYYGTYICVSSEVYAACKDEFLFRYLDKIRVKGKNIPVDIYELVSQKKLENTGKVSQIKDFKQALELYMNGDFKQAKDIFEQLSSYDAPSRVFYERCKNFIYNPPKVWDGIWNFEEK